MTTPPRILNKEELIKKLTEKERLWCHEYIIDWNKARAARAVGYSVKSCYDIGSENSRKPHIIAYIALIKDDFEAEAGVSKLMAVKRLKQFAMTDVDAIFEDWITREEFNLLSADARACIQEMDTKVVKKNIGDKDLEELVDVEHVKIKLVDKRGALQDLAKLLGWNDAEKLNLGFKSKITGITFSED